MWAGGERRSGARQGAGCRSSESGSTDSTGLIGEPLPLERLGAKMVRAHRGLSTISAGGFLLNVQELPGTFTALKRAGEEGYTVTLSCDLTSSYYAVLIANLERTLSTPGAHVSVAVEFVPSTPNEAPPSTAQST